MDTQWKPFMKNRLSYQEEICLLRQSKEPHKVYLVWARAWGNLSYKAMICFGRIGISGWFQRLFYFWGQSCCILPVCGIFASLCNPFINSFTGVRLWSCECTSTCVSFDCSLHSWEPYSLHCSFSFINTSGKSPFFPTQNSSYSSKGKGKKPFARSSKLLAVCLTGLAGWYI